MSGSAFTLVFYYIPEDKDDLKIPNAYAIPKDVNEITLNDIESFFPFKEKFHFRFQFQHGDQVVWLDLNKKNVKVPQYKNKIIMKVSREVKKDLEKDLSSHSDHPDKATESLFNL
ncbi:unnamed protein product [Moneuplotes crassus]|uniref:DIX domain-containing protein n=1 Tax=Euplotes crassus TaxID=5936 RepID=A0AAD1Y1X6_EUPCR|nr:unnamed protein product [Moneuplotes crassus]